MLPLLLSSLLLFISCALFPFLFFFILVAVALAATTTRLSFFLLALSLARFFCLYYSVVFYQQIHFSTDWLLQRRTRWWTNISRHCTEREKEKKATAALSLSFRHNSSIVLMLSLSLWLFYYSTGPISLSLSYLLLPSSLFSTGHKQAILICWLSNNRY